MPVAARPAPVSHAQTLADLIPGWSPDLPGACERADAWAGGERRPSVPTCPEIGALTRVLERYVKDGDDLRAIKEQVRRRYPAPPSPGRRDEGRSLHPALS